MALDKLKTVREFAETGPWSESSVRWMIFKNTDGFRDRCVRKIGRRIFIDSVEAERLFDEQNPNLVLPWD